jgi:hypothetical protein
MRYVDWKIVFAEQRRCGGIVVWVNPFTTLRFPKMFNLQMDPYERAGIVSDQYYDFVGPASFNVDGVRKQVDKVIDKSFKDRGLEK